MTEARFGGDGWSARPRSTPPAAGSSPVAARRPRPGALDDRRGGGRAVSSQHRGAGGRRSCSVATGHAAVDRRRAPRRRRRLAARSRIGLPELCSRRRRIDARGHDRALAFRADSRASPVRPASSAGSGEDGLARRGRPSSGRRARAAFTVRAGALPLARRHGDRALPDPPRRRRAGVRTRRRSSPATAASPSPRRRPGRRPIAAWCEAGGLFAIAGLRGGYEEGEAWHQAGRREHKQNVFDDFHAAADWLVATRPDEPRPARRSAAAPTAGCSSAPRSPSGPTCAGRCSAPCRCST